MHAPVRGHRARADRRKIFSAKKGYRSTAGIFTHVLQPFRTVTADKASKFKLINGILPDFVIDARGARFSELLQFTDWSRLDGVETLVEIMGLGIGESSDYASFRAEQGRLKPVDRRAVKVHRAYCKAAKDLDSKHPYTPDDEIGPVKSTLLSFGPVAGKYEGTVLGLGIGCFGELSAGFNDVCTFIARNRAVSYVDRYDDKSPKEALGMFRSRIRRVWSHAAVFPGATSSWIAAASSLACSRPPPAPRVRLATPILTSRTTTSSTPSLWTPDAVFTPVRGERTGMSTSGVSFLGFV